MIARGLLFLTLACAPAAARAESPWVRPMVGGAEQPELVIAQRIIEREWGPSDDSTYREVEIQGWRSETGAMALSAAVPGLGQLYAGERRGLWYALAEAGAWTARWILRDKGNDLRREAEGLAGAPADTGSAWSFERWTTATGGDAQPLRQLYAGDREAFYDLIGGDPRYAPGWRAATAQVRFNDLRERSDDRLAGARHTESLLLLNHIAAAVDALRAARLHNLPLRKQLDLKLGSGWRGRGPSVYAALETRF